ncbi:hypothetical protein E4U42_008003 [Claviceps africana]|uniref:Alpha/beta hydrolase fold-3 domain-containing protein n=1 Tax=Claviceps africana TaxID=83212 RepID=A0A8K0NFV3_9HYPO|nr:hypothetical protein E4U42_008003 [Claviceps africana]
MSSSTPPQQDAPGTSKRPPVSTWLRLGLTYLPLLARVSLSHTLNLSETSPYHSLRSALTVAFIRAYLAPKDGQPRRFSQVQARSLSEMPIRGRIWISEYTSPAPPEPEAESVRRALRRAIEALNNPDVPAPVIQVPDVAPVYGEWTGYRAGAGADEPQPDTMSGRERYNQLVAETKAPVTILYFHGGAHALMDPSTHRSAVKRLAKLTGGRAFSVRYRLAPQNAFPASLLDCLVAYLTLLYPPPGSFHDAVKPEHIVIAGDSAGGNLTMALIQVIVDLNRTGEHITWHGEKRQIPIPAAAACNSPWLDISHSSGPYYGKIPEAFDYLESIGDLGRNGLEPCTIWPADPPRKFVYAADDLMTHPLVSPVMRRDWAGFPPVYFCVGWERLAYEARFLAQKLREDGVTVVFEDYEAMPHCFALVLTDLAEAKRCMTSWAGFIQQAVEDPPSLASSATAVSAKTLEETPLEFDDLCDVSPGTFRARVVDAVADAKAWIPANARL